MMMVCEREEAGLLALRRKKRSADGCMQSEMRGAGGEQQRQMKVLSAAAVEGKARRRKERRQRQARQEPDKSVVAASGTNLGSSTCGRQYPRQEEEKEIAEGMPDAPAQCCTLQAAEGCRFGSAIPMTPRLSHRKACSQVHDDHQQQYDQEVLKGALGGTADVASQSPSPVAVATLSELHAQRMQRPLTLKEESVFQKYMLEECIAQVEAQRAGRQHRSF